MKDVSTTKTEQRQLLLVHIFVASYPQHLIESRLFRDANGLSLSN